MLLTGATTPNERITYRMARELAQEALRELVREVESAMTAQILVASERVLGTVKDVTLN